MRGEPASPVHWFSRRCEPMFGEMMRQAPACARFEQAIQVVHWHGHDEPCPNYRIVTVKHRCERWSPDGRGARAVSSDDADAWRPNVDKRADVPESTSA